MSKKRITHSAAFKAKVALAAAKQDKTLCQLAAHFKIHPSIVSKWKIHLLDIAAPYVESLTNVFHNRRGCLTPPILTKSTLSLGRVGLEPTT